MTLLPSDIAITVYNDKYIPNVALRSLEGKFFSKIIHNLKYVCHSTPLNCQTL